MSKITDQYDSYLDQHISNVYNGYNWIKENLPDLLDKIDDKQAFEKQIRHHDHSKWQDEEYEPYANYFFGKKTAKVEDEFAEAWHHHWLNNEHHPEHWVQMDYIGVDTTKPLEMPYNCILEMICDWWSFSWRDKNLKEVFTWYKKHKDKMQFNPNTQKIVESILKKLEKRVDQYELDNT